NRVKVWRGVLPHVEGVGCSATRWIVSPRHAPACLLRPGIDIHWDTIDLFARLGKALNIVGNVPRAEDFACVSAKHGGPVPLVTPAVFPESCESALRSCEHCLNQAFWYGLAEQLIGMGPIIAITPQNTRFIFDLHRNDGLFSLVAFFQ